MQLSHSQKQDLEYLIEGKRKLPHWSEKGIRIRIKHLKDTIQMVGTMRKAKLDFSDGAEKANFLQNIPESGEYKISHPTPPHVFDWMDPAMSSEIMSWVLPSLE